VTVDASAAGRTYAGSAPYEVSREKIREFAAAIGDPNPAYDDPAAARALGHDEVIAPPTFATVITVHSWRTVMADLGVDFSNVLHVDQRFVADRPLHAGDVVTTETTLEQVTERMGASWLALRTELTSVSGEHLCTATSTIMVRADDGA